MYELSRERELVKNTFILSLGRFLPKLSSLVTLPILTACLTKEEYGYYDLIATLVMLVIPIATMMIQTAAFRFLIDCRGEKEGSSKIITNIFFVTIPISIVASIVIQFFFPSLSVWNRVLIAVFFFIDTIHLTMGQITRGVGNNPAYSVGSVMLSLTNMIMVVVFVLWLDQGLLGVAIALVIANALGTVYMAIRIHMTQYLNIRLFDPKIIKELLAYSWPMVPNNLSSWILKLSDRLVITGFLGIEANATYAVANKLPNLLSIAQGVMVMAWQENASIASKDEDAGEYYSKMLDRAFCILLGFTALLIAGTPILFRLLVKGDYDDAYDQMSILIMAMFFFVMSSFFGGIYVAHKKTLNVGITTMAAAAINLAIDFALVNVIGIWAGSLSTLVAYMFLYVYRMLNCQKFQPMKINYLKQIIACLALTGMLLMCFAQMLVLDIINGALGVGVFIWFNKELLNKIFRKTTKKLRRKR